MDPQDYCQQKAVQSGSSFYYSFLFLPKSQKEAMVALYAYCREVDDVVDEISDKDVAEKTLAWWQQETNNMFQGSPSHPVTKALSSHMQTIPWSNDLFEDLLRGMRHDLHPAFFQTFEELEDYCYCVAGTVGLLSTHVFGFSNAKTLRYAKSLGTSLQLINIIRDLGEDLRRDRIYLPLEDLKRFEIDPNKLLNREYKHEQLRPLLAFEAQRARHFYQKALSELPMEDRKQQKAGLIMAAIYHKLLDTIEKDGFAVLDQKTKLTPFRKLMIAWSTLRKEKRLCKKAS